MRQRFLFALLLASFGLASCARQEPPGSQKPVAAPDPTVMTATPSAPVTPSPIIQPPAISTSQASDSGAGGETGELAEFDDMIDSAKPQTRDIPASDDPRLRTLGAGLCAAFATDTPEHGHGFFFPVAAYQQVKALPDPARDWRVRLLRGYDRDIHAIAKSMAADAVFARLEIPPKAARWVEPNEEGNRLGYYRVYGTKLHCTSGGRDRAVDLKSLISWRGRWYVVHLSSFK